MVENLVANLRDVREQVADKSKARRKYVANPFEDCTLLTSQVTRSWVEIESVLDLSRHVEIDLPPFRPGFRHEKLRACREQVADPV